MRFRFTRRRRQVEIHPDEIFIDAQNIADFDTERFEGRLERPLGRHAYGVAAAVLFVVGAGLLLRTGELQLVKGAAYAAQARDNQLAESLVFADRGGVYDRAGRPLAWNERADVADDFAVRAYSDYRGVAHVVGYVKPPGKDAAGFYYSESHEGVAGIESVYDETLRGGSGRKLTETDARGTVVSEAVVRPPRSGEPLYLSIDAVVSQALYDAIAGRVEGANYQGGAGVVMDVRSGELLALVSYPEYTSTAMATGDSAAIAAYNQDRRLPFLDRAVDGLYAPGSIVKPIVAAGAIAEGIINEHTSIFSSGSISIPNPYDPSKPSIFRDWRANGWTDAREAIAVSSDVYFYAIGGGYQDQQGMGVALIDKYLQMFGFGQDAGLSGYSSKTGTIPTPEWKAKTFPDDPDWRLGNTYHTAIGQYGTLVTPLQAARAAAAVASGNLLVPTLIASSSPVGSALPISAEALAVGREGMRMSVTDGIAGAVKLPYVAVAAKTGTAQVGMRNEHQNAWLIGFWPYQNPKYSFAIVLEKAPAGTLVGASAAGFDFFDALNKNAPQYLE